MRVSGLAIGVMRVREYSDLAVVMKCDLVCLTGHSKPFLYIKNKVSKLKNK
jgi:hypothetical protein